MWAQVQGSHTQEPDDTGEDTDPPCGNAICDADEDVQTCPYDCGFPYLVIVDQGGDTDGGSPGADLDAIKLVRDEEDHWVSAVGGSSIGGPAGSLPHTNPTGAILSQGDVPAAARS